MAAVERRLLKAHYEGMQWRPLAALMFVVTTRRCAVSQSTNCSNHQVATRPPVIKFLTVNKESVMMHPPYSRPAAQQSRSHRL